MPYRPRYFEPHRSYRRDLLVILTICLVFSVATVYYFTTHTYEEVQQKKARLFLEQIYRLERTYFEQYGTYFPIDNEINADVLQLDDTFPYKFRVEVTGSKSFLAKAWSDLDGDGKFDLWTVDQDHPSPTHQQED